MIRKISIIQEQELIKKYINGYETKILAKEYNCEVSTITNYLKKNNIPTRGYCGNLNDKNEVEIINRLRNFINIRDIMKEFKIKFETVKKVAEKYNFEMRKIKYSFDEDYFKNIDNKDKAYFLGFLYADGSVSKNNYMSLSLKSEDDYILKLFSQKLNCLGNFSFVKFKNKNMPNEYTKFALASIKFCSNLIAQGCIVNKTLKLKFPQNLENNLFWPFLRGVFDGDGNFYYQKSKNKTIWSIISNISFCQEIQNELLIRGIVSKIYQNKNKYKDIAEVRIMAHDDIKKIFHYMYADCDNLYLTRKYDKFIEFLEYNYNCRYDTNPVKRKYICKQAT